MTYETFLAGFLFVFGLAAMYLARAFPSTAGHVPMVALLVLCAASGFVLLRNLRGSAAGGPEERMDLRRDFNPKVILTVVFFLSFAYVSYWISAPLFILLICRMCGISWKHTVISAVTAFTLTYLVFSKWLQVYIEL